MYRTSPIKSGQISVGVEKKVTTQAGTIVGAVRFGGHDFTPGDAIANGYHYYSGGAAEVRSLAPINVMAGHKELHFHGEQRTDTFKGPAIFGG
jgi:hypothetical protein